MCVLVGCVNAKLSDKYDFDPIDIELSKYKCAADYWEGQLRFSGWFFNVLLDWQQIRENKLFLQILSAAKIVLSIFPAISNKHPRYNNVRIVFRTLKN